MISVLYNFLPSLPKSVEGRQTLGSAPPLPSFKNILTFPNFLSSQVLNRLTNCEATPIKSLLH